MLATRGSGKVTTMEARANKTKGIRCLERTLLGQSARKHMLDLYLYATSASFTIMDRALSALLLERQAENKRKFDNTSKNNQNQQQPNKRQNTGRAYIAGHGEKKHYGGFKPLCSKCNYHHDGPCAPKCHKCNRVGHLARDCRSSINANTANNYQRAWGKFFRRLLAI
ncbi:reverse transcriptase domain-containing protein [Tanacetum coccineum]